MEGSRRKLLFLSMQNMAAILGGLKDKMSLCLPIFPELPEGFKIMGANWSFERQGFVIAIGHESFPEVSLGSEAPYLTSNLTNHMVLVDPEPALRKQIEAMRNCTEIMITCPNPNLAFAVETVMGSSAGMLREGESFTTNLAMIGSGETESYKQGIADRRFGVNLAENPYRDLGDIRDLNAGSFSEWDRGWKQCDRAIKMENIKAAGMNPSNIVDDI